MTNVKDYKRLTPTELAHKLNERASAACLAVASAFIDGCDATPAWENLLSETAITINALLQTIRDAQRDAQPKTEALMVCPQCETLIVDSTCPKCDWRKGDGLYG